MGLQDGVVGLARTDIANAARRDHDVLMLNPGEHIGRRDRAPTAFRPKRRPHAFLRFTGMVLNLAVLAGCGPSPEDLAAVDRTPLPGDD